MDIYGIYKFHTPLRMVQVVVIFVLKFDLSLKILSK